jgi:hypothetical protein
MVQAGGIVGTCGDYYISPVRGNTDPWLVGQAAQTLYVS